MKYKIFKDVKPESDGEYWFKSKIDSKPILLMWDSRTQEFKDDTDAGGYRTFWDPEFWCEVEYPEL